MRVARLDHNASQTAIHEAGHAVERYLEHGTTGAMRREPLPGKEAGAEMEPLPPSLLETDRETGKARLREGPYEAAERARLEQEIKTTLAGAVAEALDWGRDPLEQLEQSGNGSDAADVYGIAKRLWPDERVRAANIRRAAEGVEADIDDRWQTVTALAEAFEVSSEGLAAEYVAAFCVISDRT